MGFEGYTLVACGHHMFGRVVSSDAHPEARDDWSRERDDDARGETRERGDDRDRWFEFEFEFEFEFDARARARRRCDSNADVAFGRSFGRLSRRF